MRVNIEERNERSGEEKKREKMPLYIQNLEILPKEEERIVLKNFLQALHRRLQKPKWTFSEIVDCTVRNTYAVGLNVTVIYFMRDFINEELIPSNYLVWKLLFYPGFAIVGISYASYLMNFLKNEYMPVYSREERALYEEQHSIIRGFPKKLYIPFFIFFLAAMIPSGFSIYAEGTTVSWPHSLLTLLPQFPVYLSICFFAMQIMKKLYLNYGAPLQEYLFRMIPCRKKENAVLQARLSLIEQVRTSLYLIIKKTLRIYRVDSLSTNRFQEIFKKKSNIEQLKDLRHNDIYKHLSLLISVIKTSKNEYPSDSYNSKKLNKIIFFKNLLMISVTFIYLISFLFFNEIGSSKFLETNYFGGVESYRKNTLVNTLNEIANILSYIPDLIMYPFLFKKTVSFLLNKSWDFIKIFFRPSANFSLIIQYWRHMFLLVFLMDMSFLILSLPAASNFDFSHWVFHGYNNEYDFDHVQYTGIGSLITLYLPSIMQFFLYAYPLSKILSAIFKNVMCYFSNVKQNIEIELERYLKIVRQLIKSCKPDPFLETLLGISDQQLYQLFDCDDFEILLEGAYRQKGVSIENDNLYQDIKRNLLEKRERFINQEEGKIVAIVQENTEIEEDEETAGNTQHIDFKNRLTPRETIRLIIEMRKREAEHGQRRIDRHQIQEEESEPLLSTPRGGSWLSPSWCRTASCTLY